MPLLEIDGLAASYGKALALESVSLHVEPGELVGVLGPNGAGKTTLLRAISRTLDSSGGLRLEGQSLHALEPHQVVGLGICHCPEGRHLFSELTVRKNLELGAYLLRSRAQVQAGLDQVFELFPILRERLDQVVATLSGGQQQFVAIGRALMGRPRLLLLDEPSVGIAHRLKIQIFDAIGAIAAGGVAVLMAEQDAQNTLRVAQRVYVLENGRIARHGRAHELVHDDHIRRIYLGL
ncbi:MAG TPA: ABC transporter ATP-binding protein [Ottowia sp.]|uniref:ABC transporter ATP-binding protein n=1 Tax=Ottowia sp. TaxID=1898956 RepID=UPI002B71261C|nr:ABC transporter ATP-binding protein [Ottowia sp.]HMN21341.1 ABC transporter ATP-binding protein [Ottowia sp.]